MRSAWENWRKDLPRLQELKVNHCYKPDNFVATSSSLHSFSDASDYGYGQASYLRQVDATGDVTVSLVMAKSRVVPSKPTTVPRLELTAAFVSTKVVAMVKEDLDIHGLSETYWVDSKIVLGYIQNEPKRFRTYVANQTNKIRSQTEKGQWKYISTLDNPADDTSRGLCVKDEEKVRRWFHGPPFLWDKEWSLSASTLIAHVVEDDPEVLLTVKSNLSEVAYHENGILDTLQTRVSSWLRMKQVLARVLMFIHRCKGKGEEVDKPLTVLDLKESEQLIIKMIQEKHFYREIDALKLKGKLVKTSQLSRLDPYLDDVGMLKVGGRLQRSSTQFEIKHTIILLKREIMVQRLIEWHHHNVQHIGRTGTLTLSWGGGGGQANLPYRRFF